MKRRNKGYSKKKQAEVEENIRDLIGKNYSDLEIGKILNLQPHIVRHYKNRIHEKAKARSTSATTTEKSLGFAELLPACPEKEIAGTMHSALGYMSPQDYENLALAS